MTDRFAGLPRPTCSHESPNSPKSGVMLWGKKSLLLPSPGDGLLLLQTFNNKQKLKQLQWAKIYKDAQKWSKVIFCNQSKFCIKFDDRGALVWRTKDEHYNLACLKRPMKFPTSIMVWGCVSTRVIGNIVFLKSTATADVYIKVLESHLLLFIEDL